MERENNSYGKQILTFKTQSNAKPILVWRRELSLQTHGRWTASVITEEGENGASGILWMPAAFPGAAGSSCPWPQPSLASPLVPCTTRHGVPQGAIMDQASIIRETKIISVTLSETVIWVLQTNHSCQQINVSMEQSSASSLASIDPADLASGRRRWTLHQFQWIFGGETRILSSTPEDLAWGALVNTPIKIQ